MKGCYKKNCSKAEDSVAENSPCKKNFGTIRQWHHVHVHGRGAAAHIQLREEATIRKAGTKVVTGWRDTLKGRGCCGGSAVRKGCTMGMAALKWVSQGCGESVIMGKKVHCGRGQQHCRLGTVLRIRGSARDV